MKHTNTILYQLLKFLPKSMFQKHVDEHKGDFRSRGIKCWDQFVIMVFSQLTTRQSLRDLTDNFNQKKAHHYHLGTQKVQRSTLSDANQNRSSDIYKDAFFELLNKVQQQIGLKHSSEMVQLIDSTTIDLNLNQFSWAEFRSTKAGVKLHTVYDPDAALPVYFEMTHAKTHDRKGLDLLPTQSGVTYVVDRAYNDYRWYNDLTNQGSVFVGRMKKNALYEVVNEQAVYDEQVLADETVILSSKKAKKDCPIELRRVSYVRKEDNKVLHFITNDFDRSALEIAQLYKRRWQIELFFKWIKQNLKIKRFLGRSENAVMIQVYTAMIAFLLVRLAQLTTKTDFSMQKIVRLIGMNITSRTCLMRLLQPDPDLKDDGQKYTGNQGMLF